VQWTRASFETLLGLIGGFVGLIWELLGYFFGGYEDFRFKQELISEIYSTTDANRMRDDNEPETYDAARADLTDSLETKLRYDYTYLEYLSSSFLWCCCCFRKLSCYKRRKKTVQRYELALEQLTAEVDFFSFLKLLRLSDFMSKIFLKRYQRKLVPYFKKF